MSLSAAGAFDLAPRSRANAAFFDSLDRYINLVTRPEKQAAFAGLAAGPARG